jgi:hypothetical protein
MKARRRRINPNDLAEAFRELKKLRAKVAKLEAAGRKKRSNGHTRMSGGRRNDKAH